MKYTQKQINQAREILNQAGYIVDCLWHIDDIKSRAKDDGIKLSKRQVQQVKERLGQQDINWDEISHQIEEVKNEVVAKMS